MSLETIKQASRLATRGRLIALGAAFAALACPACASKEKVASQAMGAGAGMAPPPMTAAFDPSRQVAGGQAGSPWGSPAGAMPSGMPNSPANESVFSR